MYGYGVRGLGVKTQRTIVSLFLPKKARSGREAAAAAIRVARRCRRRRGRNDDLPYFHPVDEGDRSRGTEHSVSTETDSAICSDFFATHAVYTTKSERAFGPFVFCVVPARGFFNAGAALARAERLSLLKRTRSQPLPAFAGELRFEV
jgi:hypothetical protein